MTIFDFEQQLLACIDTLVADGSDDELFASGYLRGHISLAVAQCEIQGRTLVRDVEMQVRSGLHQAYLQGELNDNDQKLVETMWQRLLQQVRAAA